MILKIQLPLMPLNCNALLYNEDREFFHALPQNSLPKIVSEACKAMPNRKVYWNVDISKDALQFKERAPEQKW